MVQYMHLVKKEQKERQTGIEIWNEDCSLDKGGGTTEGKFHQPIYDKSKCTGTQCLV